MPSASPVADVLLLRPPRHEFAEELLNPLHGAIRSYPIGLAYLAGSLRAAGFSVKILDAWAKPVSERAPLPPELSYLSRLSDLRFCDRPLGYFREGMQQREIEKFLQANRFPIVGISSMFSGYHRDALAVADAVKRLQPEAKVVLGGAAVTASPELTLSHPSVDIVCVGEGEATLPALAGALLGRGGDIGKIPGLGFKHGGRVRWTGDGRFIPELDGLARPAYDLIDGSFYRSMTADKLERYAGLFTSRGCPHRCDFCSIYLSMGRRFRAHSPERVVADIRECRDRHGIRVFHIEDDNFAFDPERAKEILRRVIAEFGPRKLVFRSLNGMTALSLRDEELVRLMGEAGFEVVMIALESEDHDVRVEMKKPGTVAHFSKAAEACERAGIAIGGFTIIGLPYSGVRQDIETALFAVTQKMTAIAPNLFYPIPRTPQYDRCVKAGWLSSDLASLTQLRSYAFAIKRPDYPRREAFTLLNLTRLFGSFKLEARRFLPKPGRYPIREVFEAHARAHPTTVRSIGGQLELAPRGPAVFDCCGQFLQVERFLKEGTLLSRVETRSDLISFKKARASSKVISGFIEGLPEHPLRYLDGFEVSFS